MAGGFLRADKKFVKPKCNEVSSKSLLSEVRAKPESATPRRAIARRVNFGARLGIFSFACANNKNLFVFRDFIFHL